MVSRVKSKFPGAHHRHVGRQLYVIFKFIEYHHLPDITALVVNQSTALPSTFDGRFDGDLDKLQAEQQSVFLADWTKWQHKFDRYNRMMLEHVKDKDL